MSSSRRSFFRDLAAAAAKHIPDPEDFKLVPAQEEETIPAPVATPLLSDEELDRYSRQLLLPEWSELAQVALRDASVMVIGLGALGAQVANHLVGAGVGRVGVVDPDVVEVANLHRQGGLHLTPNVGFPKTEAAAAKLRYLNPEVLVETYQVHLDAENARGLIDYSDLVLDCSESAATRYVLNAACCAAGVPLIVGGVGGWSGLVMAIRPGETACYRCAFPDPPADALPGARQGMLGPAAGTIGSLQSLEALKLLSGAAAPLRDAFIQLDLASLDMLRVTCARRPDCPDCSG
jgi:molybdopterin-synthase adenylyltransferase